jgi:hypothetical protein
MQRSMKNSQSLKVLRLKLLVAWGVNIPPRDHSSPTVAGFTPRGKTNFGKNRSQNSNAPEILFHRLHCIRPTGPSFPTWDLEWEQGCQIFLGTTYQNRKNIPNNHTEWPQNITNGCKTDQTALKFTNIFRCKTLQNLPKLGFFCLKICHPATLNYSWNTTRIYIILQYYCFTILKLATVTIIRGKSIPTQPPNCPPLTNAGYV